MAPNKTLVFKKVPQGLPVAGEHLAIEDRPLDLDAAPPAGHLLIKVLEASLDPYLRGKMRDPSIKSYSLPFEVNAPITNRSVGRIIASAADGFAVGDLVWAFTPIAEYALIKAEESVKKISNPHGLDLGHFLGALGMPGITAFSSFYKIGQPKKGETIFVSSAAGAVGQVVGQLAKLEGLTVIGSVGSDEKLDFIVKDLGFDAGFNYKKEKPLDALQRLAPDGIDIYFENVGGEHLDAALLSLKRFGRVIVCGLISDYNTAEGETYRPKNTAQILRKSLLVQGFIQSDPGYADAYTERQQAELQPRLADGSFRARLSVTDGIDRAAEGLIGLLKGENFGKAVVRIAEA